MDPYNSADANALPAGTGGAGPAMAAGNTSNPYAAPGAVVRDVHEEGDVILASRLARLGAVLLDSLILVVPAILAAIMLPAYQDYANRAAGGAGAAELGGSASLMIMLLGLGMIAFVVYQFVLLYRHGQTVGKKIVGIRIVRADASRASFPRLLFLRYGVPGLIGAIPIVGFIFSLIDALFIFGEERRCLHDRIADTIVVNA